MNACMSTKIALAFTFGSASNINLRPSTKTIPSPFTVWTRSATWSFHDKNLNPFFCRTEVDMNYGCTRFWRVMCAVSCVPKWWVFRSNLKFFVQVLFSFTRTLKEKIMILITLIVVYQQCIHCARFFACWLKLADTNDKQKLHR